MDIFFIHQKLEQTKQRGCTRVQKHWHLIDYTITRKKDLQDGLDTRIMRSTQCETDHQLVVTKQKMRIARKRRHTKSTVRKLNVQALRRPELQLQLQNAFNELDTTAPLHISIDEAWQGLREEIQPVALDVLGTQERKEADWLAGTWTACNL